ncbi:hypothetical protein [Streptomyces acidicola]|uniref:hypothetical protein n=1 Tax=Streptomyces acidicola TaxID=2596892 RepID=UPI001883BCAB|nr:hypothetical protein [Streptomyces acidicola]
MERFFGDHDFRESGGGHGSRREPGWNSSAATSSSTTRTKVIPVRDNDDEWATVPDAAATTATEHAEPAPCVQFARTN